MKTYCVSTNNSKLGHHSSIMLSWIPFHLECSLQNVQKEFIFFCISKFSLKDVYNCMTVSIRDAILGPHSSSWPFTDPPQVYWLPRLLSGKITWQCRKHGFDPWVRKIPRRKTWQLSLVFLPGESYGQRSLVGYSPWRCKEWDTTNATEHTSPWTPTHPGLSRFQITSLSSGGLQLIDIV